MALAGSGDPLLVLLIFWAALASSFLRPAPLSHQHAEDQVSFQTQVTPPLIMVQANLSLAVLEAAASNVGKRVPGGAEATNYFTSLGSRTFRAMSKMCRGPGMPRSSCG